MKTYKPTTPSRRQMTNIDYSEVLTSNERHKPLTMRILASAGRNHRGVITVRHQGSGNKKLYRIVDFLQNKLNVPGRVETIEYDPYRTAFIALVCYKDGERRYVLAPKNLKVGEEIITSEVAPIKLGNRLKLKNLPLGTLIHNVEMVPNEGGKLARSAGSFVEVFGIEGKYCILKLGSKEVRKVPSECFATVGQVSNPDWNLVNIGKAGKSRGLGIRPTVRGSVMNPCDHPYGGGEGKQPRGTKRPKTMWGKVTGGRKTRHKRKSSTRLIMQRRPKIR